MEKLLSTNKKQGGNNASNLTAQRTKKFSLAIGATKIFSANTLQQLFNQPYSG